MTFELFTTGVPAIDTFFLIATTIVLSIAFLVVIVFSITAIACRVKLNQINQLNSSLEESAKLDKRLNDLVLRRLRCPFIESSHTSYKFYGKQDDSCNIRYVELSFNNSFSVLLPTGTRMTAKLAIESNVENLDFQQLQKSQITSKLKQKELDVEIEAKKKDNKFRKANSKLGKQPKQITLKSACSFTMHKASFEMVCTPICKEGSNNKVMPITGDLSLKVDWCYFVNPAEVAHAKKATLRKLRKSRTPKSTAQTASPDTQGAQQSVEQPVTPEPTVLSANLDTQNAQSVEQPVQQSSNDIDDIEGELAMALAMSYDETVA